jgi:hypothetical protein
MTSPAEHMYDMPEFQEFLEVIKRAADLRIALEANKAWIADTQKELQDG